MQNLVYRIWRYLNYPPRTHGKAEEIRQRLVAAVDDYRPKVEAIANDLRLLKYDLRLIKDDLRYLKTMTVALQDQLNSVQEHLRSSQPWLPWSEGSEQEPEGCLLASLGSFFPKPILVNIGLNDSKLLPLLLNAGFEIYTFKFDEQPATSRGPEPWAEHPGLHILNGAIESLPLLAENKQAGFPILRTTIKHLDASMNRDIGRFSPQIVDTAFSRIDTDPADELTSGRKLIREMRRLGYQWNLLMFRIGTAPAVRFSVNLAEVPDMGSGNLMLFKNYEIFEQSCRWAQLVLPRFQYGQLR
jgi:hypothetical protein